MNSVFQLVEEHVKKEERELLSLWQQVVLGAMRKHKTARIASKILQREEPAIRMTIVRIRRRGVDV